MGWALGIVLLQGGVIVVQGRFRVASLDLGHAVRKCFQVKKNLDKNKRLSNSFPPSTLSFTDLGAKLGVVAL